MKELVKIQSELKAHKGQRNAFGKYNYRSCEDILEAVKPLLTKSKCTLIISDEVVIVGERYYIKATATIANDEEIKSSATAFARESLMQKGMSEPQMTGAASSYARKYALNGLFAIDDTKDADTLDNRHTEPRSIHADSNGKTLSYYGEQSCLAGKYEGIKIKDIPTNELVTYCVYLAKNDKLSGNLKMFVDDSRNYLKLIKK